MATKQTKVDIDTILKDILERLRSIEKTGTESDKALDLRLCKIESEIENVKKAAKAFSLFVKVMGGFIAFVITVWNFLGKYFFKTGK